MGSHDEILKRAYDLGEKAGIGLFASAGHISDDGILATVDKSLLAALVEMAEQNAVIVSHEIEVLPFAVDSFPALVYYGTNNTVYRLDLGEISIGSDDREREIMHALLRVADKRFVSKGDE